MYNNFEKLSRARLKTVEKEMERVTESYKSKLQRFRLGWEKGLAGMIRELRQVETLLIEDVRREAATRELHKEQLLEIFESKCLELDPNIFQV